MFLCIKDLFCGTYLSVCGVWKRSLQVAVNWSMEVLRTELRSFARAASLLGTEPFFQPLVYIFKIFKSCNFIGIYHDVIVIIHSIPIKESLRWGHLKRKLSLILEKIIYFVILFDFIDFLSYDTPWLQSLPSLHLFQSPFPFPPDPLFLPSEKSSLPGLSTGQGITRCNKIMHKLSHQG